MKRLSILIFLISFIFSVKAQYVGLEQPTITTSNIWTVGDTVTYIYVFGGDNFNPGDSGQAVIWNFADKTEIPDSMEHYYYADTTGYPHVPASSELVEGLQETPNNYFYYNTGDNGDKWQRTGFYAYDAANDLALWIDYTTDVKLLDYPFTYGSSGSSVTNYNGSGHYVMNSIGFADSASVDNGNYSYLADGWGVLVTPYKTYKHVVRIHSGESFDMSLYAYGTPFETDNITDDSYFWYSAEDKGFVMKYIHSTTSTSNGSQETYYLAWKKVYPTQLEPDFTVRISDTSVYAHIDTVNFVNLTSPIAGSSFQWSFSPSSVTFVNGTNENSTNPSVVFNAPGFYTVTLTATNSNYSDSSITKTNFIHVYEPPKLIASFTADPTVIDVNGIVNFTNTTNDKNGTTWLWQISPGSEGNQWGFVNFTTDTSTNPSVQFYQAGCYSVRLVATNDNYYNSPDDTIMMNLINVAGGCGDAYTVTFTVTDASTGNAISGATVNVNGVGTHTTDNNGQTTFSLYNGNYNFTVSATGYEDSTGTFTVADADISVPVALTPLATYTVTFTVTDASSGNAISGATVSIDGVGSQTTDDNGQTSFSLYNGNYNYTVSANGYEDTSGAFTVADADQNIDVQLTYTYVSALNDVKIYPNPTHNVLNISGVEEGKVEIYDISGKLLFEQNIKGNTQLDLNLNKGAYLLKITTNKGNKAQKLIIE